MASSNSKFLKKLFFKRWIIGISNQDIKEMIRKRHFDLNVRWFQKKNFDKFFADPFPLPSPAGEFKILIEEFNFDEDYGKLSLMKIGKNYKKISYVPLLDTNSHLSYPFYFIEDEKIYVFPESAHSGKLSCYHFDPVQEKLTYVKDILELPLRDSTIFKLQGRYWLFGAISENFANYKLAIYHSDHLLGPYKEHARSQENSGLDGIRPAGNFIEVDGALYRPTQNCKNFYGESISLKKITRLDESDFQEELYATITIDPMNTNNKGIKSIHTINVMNHHIIVDGEYWSFSPIRQLKKYLDKGKQGPQNDEK